MPIHVDHQLFPENRVRFFLDPSTWLEHRKLGAYDFSFGTRIHGNGVALLAGTPAVVLAHDSRTLELAEYHEIPHRRIVELPDGIDAVTLHEEADWGPMCAGHPARFRAFERFLAGHRLRHAFQPGESLQDFDRTLAGVDFPDPVETPMALGPEELYQLTARSRELDDKVRALERAEQRLRETRSWYDTSMSGRISRIRRAVRRRASS